MKNLYHVSLHLGFKSSRILDCAYIILSEINMKQVYDVLKIRLHPICEIEYQNISFHSKKTKETTNGSNYHL